MAKMKVFACILVLFVLGACMNNNVVEHTHLNATELPQFKGSYDEIAFETHMWVTHNITYVSDELDGRPDFWKKTKDTYESKQGDCEDGALLTAHILLKNGVPKDRVKVVGGYVYDRFGNGFGHAYCIYKRSDGEWITLDWCAWPDEYMPLKTRMPLRMKHNYGKVLFYLLGE